MKPAPFAYHRAVSIEDAIAQLKDADAIVRPLAGGQSLVPMLNLRLAPADKLVDLTRINELRQIEQRPDCIRYGALVTHAAFEDGLVPDASNGLMPFVGSQIAYRAIRTRGTIGGAVALADPAADWLTAIIALEASIALVGPNGRREISSVDFALGPYMTAIDDGELIEAIIVPRRPVSERWGHCKLARKTGEYAESMAIAVLDKASGKARLVLGATDGAPLVLERSSREIAGGTGGAGLAAVIRQELIDSGRDFSPEKLLLHGTVALRAVSNLEKRR
jgi:carbon-monoxide dehydrogenase medium subunit